MTTGGSRRRIVVVGSGPTGAMAASRLVDGDVDVIMLDSGRATVRGGLVRIAGRTVVRFATEHASARDRLDSATDDDVDWYSSLTLGGLSNYWSSAVPRFAVDDFHRDAKVDEAFDWPIDYEDLLPYYSIVERLLAITAADPIVGVPAGVVRYRHDAPSDWSKIIDACSRRGHGIGLVPMARGRPWMAVPRSTAFNSFECIVKALVGRPNFMLRSGAHVLRLCWSSREARVDAVEFLDREAGSVDRVECDDVVLAAGAIDSAVVMLRSRSNDFPAGLGNANGLVGRFLHDHPREWWVTRLDRKMSVLDHPLYVSSDESTGSSPMLRSSITLGSASKWDSLCSLFGRRTHLLGAQVLGTMVPMSSHRVEVDERSSTSPLGRPLIKLHYDDATRANLFAARRRLCDLLSEVGIGAAVTGPFQQVRPGSSVHYGGTLRMHASSAHGVVDRSNCVYDAPNVVVCDSSCFTTGPEKHPTLTAMAIAARAADRVLGRQAPPLRDGLTEDRSQNSSSP